MFAARPRALISKIGLDGHDRGAKAVCAALMKAGAEVVYLGLYQTPQQIVAAAAQEDPDFIGVSTLGGEHVTLVPKLLELLKEKGMDIPVAIGGVFAKEDIATLKRIGVSEVFVGSATDVIIKWVNDYIVPRITHRARGGAEHSEHSSSQ